jgi:excisionase family DNA binding protein
VQKCALEDTVTQTANGCVVSPDATAGKTPELVEARMADSAKPMTPKEYADSLGCNQDTVRYWIATGKLGAINVARKQGGKPRYKILPKHREEFEKTRSTQAAPVERRNRKSRKPSGDYTRFYGKEL